MNVQDLLIQLFEEAGYHREKQVRLVKLSFTGPPPGTYRFDRYYNEITSQKKAYLTTKLDKKMLEFYCDEHIITIYKDVKQKVVIDLADPDSLDSILKLIDEHP